MLSTIFVQCLSFCGGTYMIFRPNAFSVVCGVVLIFGGKTPLSAQHQTDAPPIETVQVFPDVHLRLPAWVESEMRNVFGDPATLVIESVEGQMRFVIWLSRKNVEYGTGGPFGAAIFEADSGRLVAPGVNLVVPQHCSVAHGEFTAIAVAEQRLKTFDLGAKGLPRMRLVTSSQPCVQCFGMTHWSGVTELIYGAQACDVERITGFDEGPLPKSWEKRLADRSPLPPVMVKGGVLEGEAQAVLELYMKRAGKVYNAGSGGE